MAAIELDRADMVGWLTLNRPERMNAFDRNMLALLDDTVARINASTDIAVLVLTGAGRAFCAGRDRSELGSLKDESADIPPRMGQATSRIADIEVPVIAAVNGPAVGGGLGMALMADIIIAGETATFADGHLAAGMIPSSSVWWLSRRTSYGHAMDILLTGRTLSANEAHRLGLVTHVASDEQLRRHVHRTAELIASNASRAVLVRTKRAARFALESTFARSMEQVGYLRAL